MLTPRVGSAESLSSLLAERKSSKLGTARLALAESKPAEVLELLEGYDGAGKAYAAHMQAQAQWALGRHSEAVAIWNEVREATCRAAGPSPLVELMRLKRAELAAESNPLDAAEQLLALPADATRWTEALHLLRKAGATEKHEALLRRLLITFPAEHEAQAIAEQLGSDGVRKKLGELDHRLQRVRRLMAANANQRAAEEAGRLAKELKSTHPNRCEVLYIQGRTARKRRLYDEAIRYLVRARAACRGRQKDFATRSALTEVQIYAIKNRVREARRVVDWMVTNYPTHSFTDDARFLLAETLEEEGLTRSAYRVYRAVARTKGSDHAPFAAWRLAWRDIKARRFSKARPQLQELGSMQRVRAADKARAEYWLARIEEGQSKKRASNRYAALAEQPSFYGMLALDRLRAINPRTAKRVERKLVKAAKTKAGYTVTRDIRVEPAFADAVAYAQAGEPDLAAWSVTRLLCKQRDADRLLAVALSLDAVGATPDAQLLLRRYPSLWHGALTSKNVRLWRAAYSRPFRDEIRNAAAQQKLDELLLTALVREESTFDPDVVSWAGATGLAQVMPSTAVTAYRQLKKGKLDIKRLTEPELNLSLGAHVLRQGIRSFKNPVLGLGAYNGGYGIIRRQLVRRPQRFDVWIEDFRVKETRRYMKKVSESWGIYRLLYDRKDPFVRLPKSVSRRS